MGHHNRLLNRSKEKTKIISPSYSSDLRRHFQMLLRTKNEFYKIFDIHKNENPTISASKIQNWWRKISSGNCELANRKNAVSKIEAWWIGTNTKRKINNALKSGNFDQMIFGRFLAGNFEKKWVLNWIFTIIHFGTAYQKKIFV